MNAERDHGRVDEKRLRQFPEVLAWDVGDEWTGHSRRDDHGASSEIPWRARPSGAPARRRVRCKRLTAGSEAREALGMAGEGTVDVVTPAAGAAQVPTRTVLAGQLARTMGGGALLGAVSGLLVGGVLGRLAMRLLALTSPASAQGQMTDDQAVVGTVSLSGTLGLAMVTTIAGALAGLIYLWVRRVLPAARRGRIAGFGLFTGSVGGALFVHDHPSFDYTVLTPTWLAVLLFMALPLVYGLLVSALVETLDRPSGWLRQRPAWLVIGLGVLAVAPVLPLVAPFALAAFVVGLSPRLLTTWHSPLVTVAGVALFSLLVLWGGYGLVMDVVSVATDTPSTAFFNP